MDRHGWDERYQGSDLVWSSTPNATVEAEVGELMDGGLAAGRALDLAAGEGRNAIWLAENGWSVTAVDFSRVGLQKAAHLATARGVTVELVEADVTEYEPDPGAFALVVIAYLHTPEADRRAWVGHALDALAPGGVLLVVGHDRSNLEHGVGGPQDPLVLTTPDELVALVTADGRVAVDHAAVFERPATTQDGAPAVALDHLLRAHRV